MTTSYIAPILVENGYTGATGTTPHRTSDTTQVSTLQNLYANALAGQTITKSNSTVQINLNFDGTQNNRDYPDKKNGESQTNVANLDDLQTRSGNGLNTFYFSGIGAQTVPTGTLLPNGNLDPQSSPSNLQSTPWRAGELGNGILEDAYIRLTRRVTTVLTADPDAQIALNLSGFSRGSAEAVAFANLVNERGIPGLYPPGAVPINSMVLYDPVSQTGGALDVRWPTNLSNPALVFVAAGENRTYFPAMPLGANAIVVPIDGVHSDVGGSFNQDGISAVTLKIARDYLQAAGSTVAEIPSNMQPDWSRMFFHNSAIDNYGNVMLVTNGDPLQTVGTNRYYEGTGLGGC